jgi:putative Mg2+ transporter-C (MgtC) family protein
MMDVLSFALNIGAALLMGMALGLERQFRQHPAGLRTNALVCVGAAMFVSLTGLMGDVTSPTRIASYIVSGIGFIGGGVILREGLNVKGMNTAATLWCTAAVGTLAGAGFAGHALVGTLTVLIVHVVLRPLAHWVDARRKIAADVETSYRIRVVCADKDQALIRTILLRHVNSHPKMTVQGISFQDCGQVGQVAVVADIYSLERKDKELNELVSRLSIEPSVSAVSWERA